MRKAAIYVLGLIISNTAYSEPTDSFEGTWICTRGTESVKISSKKSGDDGAYLVSRSGLFGNLETKTVVYLTKALEYGGISQMTYFILPTVYVGYSARHAPSAFVFPDGVRDPHYQMWDFRYPCVKQ